MDACLWIPTRDEINAIVGRATDHLLLTMAHVTWVPLPDGSGMLDSPETEGFICVGWIVASGEHTIPDRDVWWHPGRQEGRRRETRSRPQPTYPGIPISPFHAINQTRHQANAVARVVPWNPNK
jgi:hypothetical protein